MKVVLFALIGIIAIYLGVGGFLILRNDQLFNESLALKSSPVTYDGVTFNTKEEMEAVQQQDLILCVFPYADRIPSVLSFLLTAISFGIIGAIGKVINDTIQGGTRLRDVKNLLLITVQGAIIGLIILGVSFTIPVVLTNEKSSLNPVTVVFLSLFGGIYYLKFFNWITNVISKVVFEDPSKAKETK
jgi:hypothetical protein